MQLVVKTELLMTWKPFSKTISHLNKLNSLIVRFKSFERKLFHYFITYYGWPFNCAKLLIIAEKYKHQCIKGVYFLREHVKIITLGFVLFYMEMFVIKVLNP